MLIRILQQNPGSVLEVGQLIKVGDVQGNAMVRAGLGESVDEIEVIKPPIPRVSRERGNPFMLPPRWIAPDGFVAKSEEELAKHQCDCQ